MMIVFSYIGEIVVIFILVAAFTWAALSIKEQIRLSKPYREAYNKYRKNKKEKTNKRNEKHMGQHLREYPCSEFLYNALHFIKVGNLDAAYEEVCWAIMRSGCKLSEEASVIFNQIKENERNSDNEPFLKIKEEKDE